MSLANDNDIIIPGTTGLITALGREANEHNKQEEIATYIREVPKAYGIVNGRANGISLRDLVSEERLSDGNARIENTAPMNKEGNTAQRVYEDWMR